MMGFRVKTMAAEATPAYYLRVVVAGCCTPSYCVIVTTLT